MIIKPNDEILRKTSNIIEANTLRMKRIQEVLNDQVLVNAIFDKLELAFRMRDKKSINVLVRDILFYEDIGQFECTLIDKYNSVHDKIKFINDLKKSYMVRGVKGFKHAWTYIIFE